MFKKLLVGCLLAASTMFGAGFGSASVEQDIILENPFTGKPQRFMIGTVIKK